MSGQKKQDDLVSSHTLVVPLRLAKPFRERHVKREASKVPKLEKPLVT